MPIRRRSAARAGPMLGSCSRCMHSAALGALGDLMTMAGSSAISHQHVVANEADGETFDLEGVFRADDDGLEFGVLGQQLDRAAAALEAIDRDLVAEPGDDDLAVLRLMYFLH